MVGSLEVLRIPEAGCERVVALCLVLSRAPALNQSPKTKISTSLTRSLPSRTDVLEEAEPAPGFCATLEFGDRAPPLFSTTRCPYPSQQTNQISFHLSCVLHNLLFLMTNDTSDPISENADDGKPLKDTKDTLPAPCPPPQALNGSTDTQTKGQPQGQTKPFISFSGPGESLITMALGKKKKKGGPLIVEPDPDDIHPDIDYTNPANLTRLLALFQNGWILSRGRGPRNQDTCLWCRGDIAEDAEILTHVGSGNSCRNSWPATCLLQWIDDEIDVHHPSSKLLRCPMCREEFYTAYGFRPKLEFLKVNEAEGGVKLMDAAFTRVVLFSPTFAKEACLKKGMSLIFMQPEEIKKIGLWGKHRKTFADCEALRLKNPTEDMDYNTASLPEPTITTGNLNPFNSVENLAFPVGISGAVPAASSPIPSTNMSANGNGNQKGEEEQTFDTTWVLIDYGNNEFRITPFLSEQAEALKKDMTEHRVTVTMMDAQAFNEEAKKNGGLVAAVKGFKVDVQGMGEMMESGKEFVKEMFKKAMLPEGKHEKQWYRRLLRAFAVVVEEETERRHGDEEMDVPVSWSGEDSDDSM